MVRIIKQVGVGGPHEPDARQECWFCLASPQLEDHLVCSVADEIYLAQPKVTNLALRTHERARMYDFSCSWFRVV